AGYIDANDFWKSVTLADKEQTIHFLALPAVFLLFRPLANCLHLFWLFKNSLHLGHLARRFLDESTSS
ncbi:hypothetical protein, partial [Aeromonas bestiarum]|uniref:hypothetical protein n=1 Tax=Aeromonas bestiarum TaxID=105751 RepID=UPI003D1A11DD